MKQLTTAAIVTTLRGASRVRVDLTDRCIASQIEGRVGAVSVTGSLASPLAEDVDGADFREWNVPAVDERMGAAA